MISLLKDKLRPAIEIRIVMAMFLSYFVKIMCVKICTYIRQIFYFMYFFIM